MQAAAGKWRGLRRAWRRQRREMGRQRRGIAEACAREVAPETRLIAGPELWVLRPGFNPACKTWYTFGNCK